MNDITLRQPINVTLDPEKKGGAHRVVHLPAGFNRDVPDEIAHHPYVLAHLSDAGRPAHSRPLPVSPNEPPVVETQETLNARRKKAEQSWKDAKSAIEARRKAAAEAFDRDEETLEQRIEAEKAELDKAQEGVDERKPLTSKQQKAADKKAAKE